jgi:hypothetical protein
MNIQATSYFRVGKYKYGDERESKVENMPSGKQGSNPMTIALLKNTCNI